MKTVKSSSADTTSGKTERSATQDRWSLSVSAGRRAWVTELSRIVCRTRSKDCSSAGREGSRMTSLPPRNKSIYAGQRSASSYYLCLQAYSRSLTWVGISRPAERPWYPCPSERSFRKSFRIGERELPGSPNLPPVSCSARDRDAVRVCDFDA
jgi:hypothetical protein